MHPHPYEDVFLTPRWPRIVGSLDELTDIEVLRRVADIARQDGDITMAVRLEAIADRLISLATLIKGD